VHTRVQPIVQAVPRFPHPHSLPVINANPRVEQMTKVRNPLLMQAAVSSKAPMLPSKSALGQAVLSRGMASAQAHLEAQNAQHLQFAGIEQEHPMAWFNEQYEQFANPRFGNLGISQYRNIDVNEPRWGGVDTMGTIGDVNVPYVNNRAWRQQQQYGVY